MAQRFDGIAFGPGFNGAGSRVSFEADAAGLRLATAAMGDGAPRWSVVAAGGGWDGGRLTLEWDGTAGRYALTVTDAATVRALAALVGHQPVAVQRAGSATRVWAWGLIGATVVLPLVLLVALIAAHDRIADWIVDRIPVEQEMKLGAEMFDRHKRNLKPVEGAAQAMVREIGARLTQGSRYRYQFHVSADKSVNAYAVPGGFIVVHSGLLALADTADEVAGVLAHEVAHVERRHGFAAMVKSTGLYATVAVLFGDFGSLAGAGAQLLDLKFSRDHERDADSEGMRLLVKAGVPPAPMASFFKKMAAQGTLVPALLSTHPASEERFAAIDRAVQALPEAARAVAPLDYDYRAIKATLPK